MQARLPCPHKIRETQRTVPPLAAPPRRPVCLQQNLSSGAVAVAPCTYAANQQFQLPGKPPVTQDLCPPPGAFRVSSPADVLLAMQVGPGGGYYL